MQIELTEAEHDLLVEILQERHAAIVREILHTDHHKFKQMLKERENRLEKLLERFGVEVSI